MDFNLFKIRYFANAKKCSRRIRYGFDLYPNVFLYNFFLMLIDNLISCATINFQSILLSN